MAEPLMPSVLVLIVCKVLAGTPDANTPFTGWQDTEWDLSGGVMHCRSQEVQLYDPAVDQGADPMPFTPMACMIAAMKLGPQFDVDAIHNKRPWRFWRAACPTPIRSGPSPRDPIIGWTIPTCPRKDGMVVCEGSGSEI